METIIFDFDYTLADSSIGAMKCICYALKKLDIEIMDENEIKKTIGMSLFDTYTYLTGDNNKSAAKLFSEYFVERADQIMTSNTFFSLIQQRLFENCIKEKFGLELCQLNLDIELMKSLDERSLIHILILLLEGKMLIPINLILKVY